MRRWTALLAALLLALALATPASAADVEDALTQDLDPLAGLPSEAVEELGPFEPETEPELIDGVWRLFTDAVTDYAALGVPDAIRTMGMLLFAALLTGLLEAQGGTGPYASAAGCLAITLTCVNHLRTSIAAGVRTAEQIHNYLRLLLPGMAGLMAASGSLSGAAALQMGAGLCFTVLTGLVCSLITPLIWAQTGICAAQAVLDLKNLSELRGFLKWAVTGLMKLVFWAFTGLLTATGLFAGAADARRLRLTRSAISGMVPVVGGLVSGASEALLSAASMLRASVGVYGMLAVLALCLTPFLRLWIQYLALRLTAAVAGLLGKGRQIALLKQLGEIMGQVLAMTGICCILALLTLTLCVQAVFP